MKKLLSIAAAVCMSFTLVACGGNSGAVDKSEEEATAIVNGFFDALHAGDVEKASSYANEEVTKDLSQITDAAGSLEDVLGQYEVEEATREKYRSIVPMIVKAVFEKSEIKSTEKIDSNAYSFIVENTGVKLDAVGNLDQAFDTVGWVNENTEDLYAKVDEVGEDGAIAWMMDKMADYMIDSIGQYFDGQERETLQFKVNVEKFDDQWIITKME